MFQAVNKREYMLAANHKEEMDEWLYEIRKCMEEDQGSTGQRYIQGCLQCSVRGLEIEQVLYMHVCKIHRK